MDNTNNEVYQLARLLYLPEEIAIMLGMEEYEVEQSMLDKNTDFYQQYHRGYYETDVLLRQSILKLAQAGSSPAQTMATHLLKNNIIKSPYHG